MSDIYAQKDNEFIAWYPQVLSADAARDVWAPASAAFYVHIPFCTAICDYCGFAVQRDRDADRPRYLDALHAEIDRYAESGRLAGYAFDCGHFGGGTPSVLPPAELVAVKNHLASVAALSATAEVTVEVNPISFTEEHADTYGAAGINRISVGVQSFDEHVLRTIGRPHGRTDVEDAISVLRGREWDNFSLDIIYGVPGQTVEGLREDLRRAADTGAAHLSCFRLEIIPFTALRLRESVGQLPSRLPREMLDEMDDVVTTVLTELGFRGYGAFNFARPGYESRHNDIAFMAPQEEYFGFGNGAYSYARGHVYCNQAMVHSYVELVESGQDPIAFARKLSALEEMSRYFVLGLKFIRVARAPFVAAYGLAPEDVFGDQLDRLLAAGMLAREDDDYVLTRMGLRYVNNVCKEFYVGDNKGRRQQMQFVPNLTPNQILGYARRAGLVKAGDLNGED